MESNYKPLGNYIKQIKKKNTDGSVSVLKGIRINKEFMESVANIQGTDLSKYRVVEKYQFAYNPMHVGRDEILPISVLLEDEQIIVSPAYVIFEILDHNILDPEYLMMWCRRSEFDRNVWFTTDSSVRGGFSWNSLCELELPIPSIEKQRAIVKEYNTIVNRIRLNDTLNQKLEDTTQALYKHWFVDFEFPNAEGKPYKSSGGKMVYNEELDMAIPLNWIPSSLEDVTLKITDGTHSTVIDDPLGEYYLLSCKNIKNNSIVISNNERKINKRTLDFLRKRTGLRKNDLLVTTVGTIGEVAQIDVDFVPYELQRSVAIIRPDISKISNQYLFQFIKGRWFKEQTEDKISGSVQRCLFLGAINEMIVIVPKEVVQEQFEKTINSVIEYVKRINIESLALENLRNMLLSKMSKAETKTVVV